MKAIPFVLVFVMAAATPGRSQESDQTVPQSSPVPTPAPSPQTARVLTPVDSPVTAWLPAPPDDAAPPPAPAPDPALPNFKVKSTSTRLVDVVESPPMPGLPPVTGPIRQTVQLVEDPGLPDPPPPPPQAEARPITDPDVLAKMAAWRANRQETRTAIVSATVYDHSRTYLRCYPSGEPDTEICGWSNLDFNHFTGFSRFEVKGRDGKVRKCEFFMAISNTDTARLGALLAQHGKTYTAPAAPALPNLATQGAAFVITSGDTTNVEAMEIFEGMHALYRTEGAKMAASYQARIQATEERRAYFLAHPPVPKDSTTIFWKRKSPSPIGLKNIQERTNP